MTTESPSGPAGRPPTGPPPADMEISLSDILTPAERQAGEEVPAAKGTGAPSEQAPVPDEVAPGAGGAGVSGSAAAEPGVDTPAPDEPSGSPGVPAATPSRRPTQLAVVEGVLQIIPGDPGGSLPLLETGPHVTAWVNGNLLTRPRRIDAHDELTATADSVEPQTSVSVDVSPDGLKAVMRVDRVPGVRYVLADVPPSSYLRLEARPVEEMPAPPVTTAQLQEALERAQVRFGVKPEALASALGGAPSEPVLVAEGIAPVEPVDGRVEYRFEERQAPTLDPEAERIDLFDRGAITWVEAGEVVAVLHPPREGSPGTDVHGKPVPVRKPKAIGVRAGKGCALSEDGTSIVAQQAGRPQLAGTILSVVPVYELAGNADVSTGHIRFSGDVHVRGDVLESIEVRAGGEVRVGGLVGGARIWASGPVNIGRTIIGSEIEAGGQAARLQEVLPVLSTLGRELGALVDAARLLLKQIEQMAGAAPGARLSTGEVVKRLLERKFWGLPKEARRLGELSETLEMVSPRSRRVADRAVRYLVGGGPLRLGSLDELAELSAEIADLLSTLEAAPAEDADVTAYSIQNSRVEASGTITIRGTGCFNSTLIAGKGFQSTRGVVRGGQVVVTEGNVQARELGGPTGVPTAVTVVRKGKILATFVHPHVTISIGGQKHVFTDGARSLRASLGADGKLAVEHLKIIEHKDAGAAGAPAS